MSTTGDTGAPARAPWASENRTWLAEQLLTYARQRRWFRGKARTVAGAAIHDVVPLDASGAGALIVLRVDYAAGDPELYVVPIAEAEPAVLADVSASAPHAVVVRPELGGQPALVDSLATGAAGPALLRLIEQSSALPGDVTAIRGERVSGDVWVRAAGQGAGAPARVEVSRAEQSNSNVVFDRRVLLKVYRQLTAGPNPEWEVGRFVTERCSPPCSPRVFGALALDAAEGTYSLGIAHEFVPNHGDAWTLTLDEAREDLRRLAGAPAPATAAGSPEPTGVVGRFLPMAARLGRRTAALHQALASDPDHLEFAPEGLGAEGRAALVTRARQMLAGHLATLRAMLPSLPATVRASAEAVLRAEPEIVARLVRFGASRASLLLTRTHGDLHLGQVLVVDGEGGPDFLIVDFEGEPARPLAERRAKASPLRDVMGMVRSFDYAAESALRELAPEADARRALAPWALWWKREVKDAFLRPYLTALGPETPLFPAEREEARVTLEFYELEKVIYEIGYELNNRPDWLDIPLRGLAAIAGVEETA